MSDEIAVVAIAEAKPGREVEVEEAIRTCVGPTRKEAGCVLSTPPMSMWMPGAFRLRGALGKPRCPGRP